MKRPLINRPKGTEAVCCVAVLSTGGQYPNAGGERECIGPNHDEGIAISRLNLHRGWISYCDVGACLIHQQAN